MTHPANLRVVIYVHGNMENSRDRNRYSYELLIFLGSKMSFVNMTYFITHEGR